MTYEQKIHYHRNLYEKVVSAYGVESETAIRQLLVVYLFGNGVDEGKAISLATKQIEQIHKDMIKAL